MAHDSSRLVGGVRAHLPPHASEQQAGIVGNPAAARLRRRGPPRLHARLPPLGKVPSASGTGIPTRGSHPAPRRQTKRWILSCIGVCARALLVLSTLTLVFAPGLAADDTSPSAATMAAAVLAPTGEHDESNVVVKARGETQFGLVAVLIALLALIGPPCLAWLRPPPDAWEPHAPARYRRRRGPPVLLV